MRASTWIALGVGAALGACDAGTPLERSCDGEAVSGCRAHELVLLRAFTVEPAELRQDDVFANLDLHAEIDRCDGSSAESVGFRVDAEFDAEGGTRMLPLFRLGDDGTQGDGTAADGVVDKQIENPFTGLVPVGPLVLRARTYSASCESEPLEADFQLLPAPR